MKVLIIIVIITLGLFAQEKDYTLTINVGKEIVTTDTTGMVYATIGKKVNWESGYYVHWVKSYQKQEFLNRINRPPEEKHWYYDNKWNEIEKPPIVLVGIDIRLIGSK